MEPVHVIETTAGYYGFEPDDLTVRGIYRPRRMAEARKTAMFLVRLCCGLSYRATAELFHVEHRAVSLAWNDLHQTPDPNAAEELTAITERLKQST